MTSRILGSAVLLGLVSLSYTTIVSAQDTKGWYPLEPGDSWTYQKETLDGNMARPDVEHWTTQETVVSAMAVPGLAATLVTKRTEVLNHGVASRFLGLAKTDSSIPVSRAGKEVSESHLLIYKNCVYMLDGFDSEENWDALDDKNHFSFKFTDDVRRGNVPADFCFPMVKGMTWGKVRDTSPAEEWVWHVGGLNADPFGFPGARTFHLSSYEGAGEVIDRWFEEGIGVVQEVIEHHGTYDEDRRQLLRATIHGKTQNYQLTPARTVPLSDGDCSGRGWQHFSRANGAAFRDVADCVSYSSSGRK